MTYKCINEKCSSYNQEIHINIHFVYRQEETIDKNLLCPICESEREVIQEDKGFCTTVKGRPNVPNKWINTTK